MLAWSCKQHERGMMSASVVTERSEGASLLPLEERGRDACSCYRGSDSELVVRCKEHDRARCIGEATMIVLEREKKPMGGRTFAKRKEEWDPHTYSTYFSVLCTKTYDMLAIWPA